MSLLLRVVGSSSGSIGSVCPLTHHFPRFFDDTVRGSIGAPGGYFGKYGANSSDDDNMIVGTSDASIQVCYYSLLTVSSDICKYMRSD